MRTVQQTNRVITWIALAVAITVLFVWGLSGCASIKSAAAPAGGAAGGAAVGSLLPPFGPIIGAAVGAVITHAIAENAALRSGETIGEGALKKEQLRWRGKTPEEWEEFAYGSARAASWADKWKWRIVWGFAAFFAFLRRQYLWKAITGQKVKSRFWALIHAFSGANWTRTLAFGFDPMHSKKSL